MNILESDHPDVNRKFEAGFHEVQRGSRLWVGLSTDVVIEQVLMRSLKTSGGLTRGRGMAESTESDLAALYASVCRDESCHAGSKPRI